MQLCQPHTTKYAVALRLTTTPTRKDGTGGAVAPRIYCIYFGFYSISTHCKNTAAQVLAVRHASNFTLGVRDLEYAEYCMKAKAQL